MQQVIGTKRAAQNMSFPHIVSPNQLGRSNKVKAKQCCAHVNWGRNKHIHIWMLLGSKILLQTDHGKTLEKSWREPRQIVYNLKKCAQGALDYTSYTRKDGYGIILPDNQTGTAFYSHE